MAKDTNNLAVRFFLKNEADKIAFERMKDLMVFEGIEFAEWFSDQIRCEVAKLGVGVDLQIVDSEYLKKYVRETFGKELSKGRLQLLRQNVWELGKEYYSAPKGNLFEIRYNFEECLPELNKFGEK